ncbi:DUF2948 family protein [Roseibium sp. RKSG952]|uniref:DUF2948 family protein n=1 Tax=Roseibium sp. RKSG952 TaxID=2529384 RepID=UPI0012BC1556|nr:DUF2948 family protein [Roseibium sp. RKSG952]MTH97657.1 DUF2948 family protein [Roseibium sp. RKSG952]
MVFASACVEQDAQAVPKLVSGRTDHHDRRGEQDVTANGPLKLAALDVEDLEVISTHLQDAIMMVGDIRYLPKEKKAVFVMNRFVWDQEADKRTQEHERRRSALAISQVSAMKASKIRQNAKDAVLELLAVTFEPSEGPSGRVKLEFAGGGTVMLEVECIEAQLADLGAAWSTPNKPAHDLN